jgi:hypothetical protein
MHNTARRKRIGIDERISEWIDPGMQKRGGTMKTVFVVSEKRVDDHAGETYDYILEVDDAPTTLNIQEIADRVRVRIRSMWMEQVKPESGDPDPDPMVVCTVDASPVFRAMLIDLQIILKEDEGIMIDLPGIETNPEPTDPEARRAIGLPA